MQPRNAPPIAPLRAWARLPSCPMPWEEQDPTDTQTIGTNGYGPLPAQALIWAIAYHVPLAVVQAAFAPEPLPPPPSLTVEGEAGDGSAEVSEHTDRDEDGDGDGDGDDSGDADRNEMTASERTMSTNGGDTWLVERGSVGAFPQDAHAAGYILTCPRLEEGGSMGLEVLYGMNSHIYRAEQRDGEGARPVEVERREENAVHASKKANCLGVRNWVKSKL